MNNVDPLVTSLYMVVAFFGAGVIHSAFLASSASRRLFIPVDGNLRFRGKRLFGSNKTVRGFVAMTPAAAFSFWALGSILASVAPELRAAIWPLSNGQLALLGAWAGLAFMVAELPNSFVKRQLDIPPGHGGRGKIGSLLTFMVDRLDSVIGVLVAVSLATPTPWMTWVYVILFGPCVHLFFSFVLYRLGEKARPA